MIKGINYIGQALGLFLTLAIIKPTKLIAIFIFRYFLVYLYRGYRIIKKWLGTIFAPAKNKIIYPLLNKSTIHFVIILIGIAVVGNNFFINEIRAEEFGQKTVLGSMILDINDIEIVETAINDSIKYVNLNQILGSVSIEDASRNELISQTSGSDNIVTTTSSAALVRPALASGSDGSRTSARNEILYYTVLGGDTVSTIAEKFNISTNTILWENKLGPRDYIKPGDKLTILPESGLSHQVKSGDTIDKIASKYSTTADKILEYNQLADISAIEVDQILLIPGGIEPAPLTPKVTAPSSVFSFFNIPPPAANTSGTKLLWPTPSRRINQYFKWRHTGIDIDGEYSSPIYAAESGRVEASGWGSGYGLRLIIDHGNGIKTLYGHESKLFVKTGDYVERGQTIGMQGCTGWCTGVHVHFEVIVNGRKVNPLMYL